MILVIVEITIPIIAVIGLSRFLNQVDNNSKKYVDIWKSKFVYLLISFSIIIIICFGFLISGFDFITESERMILESNKIEDETNQNLILALIDGRSSLFSQDIWRTILFVFLAASTLLLFLMKKIEPHLN